MHYRVVTSAISFMALAGPIAASAEARRASEPAVAGTLTVTSVVLPEKKAAARDLRFALGDQPEAALGELMGRALLRHGAFADVVADGGETSLEVRVVSVRQDRLDLPSPGPEAPFGGSRLTLAAEVHLRWARSGSTIHESDVKRDMTRKLDAPAQRADLTEAWRELFGGVARVGFADAYEAGAFGVKPAGPWIEGDTDP
jgi:hypothetical protein